MKYHYIYKKEIDRNGEIKYTKTICLVGYIVGITVYITKDEFHSSEEGKLDLIKERFKQNHKTEPIQ